MKAFVAFSISLPATKGYNHITGLLGFVSFPFSTEIGESLLSAEISKSMLSTSPSELKKVRYLNLTSGASIPSLDGLAQYFFSNIFSNSSLMGSSNQSGSVVSVSFITSEITGVIEKISTAGDGSFIIGFVLITGFAVAGHTTSGIDSATGFIMDSLDSFTTTGFISATGLEGCTTTVVVSATGFILESLDGCTTTGFISATGLEGCTTTDSATGFVLESLDGCTTTGEDLATGLEGCTTTDLATGFVSESLDG
jgi:hypothetical protein